MFDTIPSQEIINKTIAALQANNIDAEYVATGAEAKDKALSLIPEGSEVMTMTSVTNDTIGLKAAIDDSGKYDSVRNKLNTMDRATQGEEMQKLGVAPAYTTGSVHALTQNGDLIIASNTGSQLAAEVYGAAHVILVVGAQKIVANLDDAMRRINEYILPKESVRLSKVYNNPDLKSNVSKVLVIHKEIVLHRIHVILVGEDLGF